MALCLVMGFVVPGYFRLNLVGASVNVQAITLRGAISNNHLQPSGSARQRSCELAYLPAKARAIWSVSPGAGFTDAFAVPPSMIPEMIAVTCEMFKKA
jgi:hypothetical protein